jgi:hypothetical protein
MERIWTCHCCGQQFNTLLTDYAFAASNQWDAVSQEERDSRTRHSADVCIIDRKDFFVRGCIEMPIIAADATFIGGVWVSVSRASFVRIHELWDATVTKTNGRSLGGSATTFRISGDARAEDPRTPSNRQQASVDRA